MNKIIRWVKSWMSMKRQYSLFTDVISGDVVYLYKDCFEDEYMANYFYIGFRVKRNNIKDADCD